MARSTNAAALPMRRSVPRRGALADARAAVDLALKAVSSLELDATMPDELAELTVGLVAAQSSLDAQVARAANAFAESGYWGLSGARSAKAWLVDRTGIRPDRAARSLRHGRAMRHLPEAGAAWEAGELTADHMARLVQARNARTAEQLTADEHRLVEHAKLLNYREFDRLVTYWSQHADPEGADRDADAQRAARSAFLTQSFDGMWMGQMNFDPLAGAVVALELERREQVLYEADKADARRRLGRDPTPDELGRTPAQRRADAIVEMAKRSAAKPADATEAEILLSVLVGEGTFANLCESEATGRPVVPGALRDWLDDAVFERILFDAPDRVLSVSRRREFRGTVRRAVIVRDRRCGGDSCDVPGHRCQVDHVFPYTAGGMTAEANGDLQCSFHNGRKGTQVGTRSRPAPDRYLLWLDRDAGPDPP